MFVKLVSDKHLNNFIFLLQKNFRKKLYLKTFLVCIIHRLYKMRQFKFIQKPSNSVFLI